MKSRYLIAFVLGFASTSHGALLDDWSNDNLCGWMESAATPEHIQKEVVKREIICFEGVQVSSLPVSNNSVSKNGTIFPSPDSSLIDDIKATYDLGPKSVMGY